MNGTDYLWLVTLSLVVATTASYVAFDLAAQVTAATNRRMARIWLVASALSMGVGVWSTQLIGMLASRQSVPMSYNISLTALSLVIAVTISGFALHLVSGTSVGRNRVLFGGLAMGIGIATMHYFGVAATHVRQPIHYDGRVVALSIVIAVVTSLVALWIRFRSRHASPLTAFWRKTGGAILMGGAIGATHYSAMAATIFTAYNVPAASPQALDNVWLAAVIAIVVVLQMASTLGISLVEASRARDVGASKLDELARWERAHELLRRSEEARGRAQRIARLGNWELEVTTGKFSFSAGDIFGLGPAEFGGTMEHFYALVHPDDRAMLRVASERAVRQGTLLDIEYRIVRPDGEQRLLHVLGAEIERAKNTRMFSGTVQDVTERRAESRRLAKSEAMLARSQRSAQLGSWEIALGQVATGINPVLWSDETFRIFGYQPGEVPLSRERFEQHVHPDDLNLVRASISDAELGTRDYRIDYRIVLRDGTVRHVHEEADVVRDLAGTPTSLVGTIQDITARKNSELVLRRSEERLSAILENAPSVAVQRYDRAGRVLYYNPASTLLSGFNAEEALGRTLDQLTLSVADACEFLGMIERIERTGEVVGPFESNVIRRDGEARTVLSTVFRIPEPLGGYSFVCMDIDITERKRAELELRQARVLLEEQQQRFRSLFDYHPDAVFAYALDGLMTACNDVVLTLTGRTREQLIGKQLGQALLPDELPKVRTHFWRAARGEPHGFETRGIRPDGTQFSAHVTVLPIVVDQRITGVFAIARDITELARANFERDAALANVERSNRDLQDFAFVASHDLQEPLRKVQTFGSRLRGEYAALLGVRGSDYLERMTGAAVRMQRLIEDLLRYSRVTSRGEPFESVELAVIAGDVLSDLETSVEAAQATVELRDLPRIDADPTQMRQLFQNLLGNALKFRDAERPVRISVSASESQHDGMRFYRIEFRDNGIGFEPQFAENIFKPFHRLHGRGQFEGSGIGLAIVRKIAERHGGSVVAESQPGIGSTFIVELQMGHTALPATATATAEIRMNK